MERPIRRIKMNVPFQKALSLYTEIGRNMAPEFTIDHDNAFVIHNLVKWLIGDEIKSMNPFDGRMVKGSLLKGIYLCGPTGTGKTMALRVLSAMAQHTGAVVNLYGRNELLIWNNSLHATRISEIYSLTGSLDYARLKILCIQDLGTEPEESIYNGNRRDVLGSLLCERGDNPGRMTLITSNYPISELSRRYDDRIASRIAGMCNYYELKGEDRRMRLWKE